MTIQQLHYVVALDKHRHYVKASESCNVAQPTLTLQVKKLEQEIATVLFDRSKQPLKPTAMGELFITKARFILESIIELKELINENKTAIDGEFRVGIIPTLAPDLLPLFVSDFISHHPDTKLVIEELQSENIIDLLLSKQLDIGILVTPLNEREIREIPLFYEPFMVYTDEKNTLLREGNISKDKLKPEGLWLLKKGHCFRNQTLNVCDFDTSHQHKNLQLEGSSIETLKKMIKKVNGYTLIPALSYNPEMDSSHVIEFQEPRPVREVSIVTHEHFTKEVLITELRKSILRNIPDAFQKNTKFKTVKWR